MMYNVQCTRNKANPLSVPCPIFDLNHVFNQYNIKERRTTNLNYKINDLH